MKISQKKEYFLFEQRVRVFTQILTHCFLMDFNKMYLIK